LVFDQEFENGSGRLLGVEIAPQAGNEAAMVSNTYTRMHAILGNPGEHRVKATATHLGVKLTRDSHKCENCAIGKAKKNNVPQVNLKKATKKGGRLSLDITSVMEKSIGGAKFWLLVQDQLTDCCWSYFLKKKGDSASTMIVSLRKIKKEQNISRSRKSAVTT
jgi:hypothetical protein